MTTLEVSFSPDQEINRKRRIQALENEVSFYRSACRDQLHALNNVAMAHGNGKNVTLVINDEKYEFHPVPADEGKGQ